MTSPQSTAWRKLRGSLRGDGISIKWIGSNDIVWPIAGVDQGVNGAVISGPIEGMVHVPFEGIWTKPAYAPPRFERTVDARREISTRITLMSDSDFGWFDTEAKWWDGMKSKTPGWWTIWTRRYGELYLPMQLLEAVKTPLEDDPTEYGNNCQEWDILLAADGDPRWRQPDLSPPRWVNNMSVTTSVKRDESKLAPNITVGVGTLKVANRGTEPSWPIYWCSAPGRVWLPDGMSGRMLRVPELFAGEHVLIDTNPANRIAISAIDPVDDWTKKLIRNSELLSWLFGSYGDSGQTIVERFHGQGFTKAIEPNTVATLPVFHSQNGGTVRVALPQRFERAIS